MIAGFDPIVGPNTRVLVLGSVPGRRSLEEGRYYAQPGNAFWPIIEQLFAEGRVLDFEQRYDLVRDNDVALWDVIHLAERPGSSSDAAIQLETVVPFCGLPSTSGANAAMSFEVKLVSWRQIATTGR